MALNARVEICSIHKTRAVPLNEFFVSHNIELYLARILLAHIIQHLRGQSLHKNKDVYVIGSGKSLDFIDTSFLEASYFPTRTAIDLEYGLILEIKWVNI